MKKKKKYIEYRTDYLPLVLIFMVYVVVLFVLFSSLRQPSSISINPVSQDIVALSAEWGILILLILVAVIFLIVKSRKK